MKLKIFYSWQSDLPNNTNRQFIMTCLEKAMSTIHQNNISITDWSIESDSRGENGTPELASTIFSKIDQSDIFVADISIINQGKDFRRICNPNVLIELGYASSRLGWDRILCVYNLAYGQIEDLPFDIRHRKPLTYISGNKELVKIFTHQLQSIIDNRISNKKYFTSIKKEIDLSLQAILIDISKMLFFREIPKCYNYNLVIHSTIEELVGELFERKLLGFQLFKNNTLHLEEFITLYNNQVYLNFLNEKEKHTLAKIILQFKDFSYIINNIEIYNNVGLKKEYCIIDTTRMNKENPKDSYVLTEKIEGDKHIVLDSGIFKKSKLKDLTNLYQLKPDAVQFVAQRIVELSTEINEWIRITGNYFVVNERLLH
jgi:hypothetical protein